MHLLHTIGDTVALTATLAGNPTTALIVGAGYLGLEMAEALRTRGIAVTMVEQLAQVLPTVDPQLAVLIEDELARHQVEVVTGTVVTQIQRGPSGLSVTGHATDRRERAFVRTVDVVLVVVGVRPDTELGQAAGLPFRRLPRHPGRQGLRPGRRPHRATRPGSDRSRPTPVHPRHHRR